MTDDELAGLVHESFEPIRDAAPSRDLWPLVAAHRERRAVPPWFDLALAGATLALCLARPDWLVLVAYLF